MRATSITVRCALLGLALTALGCVELAGAQTSGAVRRVLGTIDFETSALPAAQAPFRTGVLALHSFWYEEARAHFARAQALDPGFGMAYWGEAMSYDNALGTHTDATTYEQLGEQAIARLDRLDAEGQLRFTARERAYADAVRARFASGYAYVDRRQAYAQAMEELATRYPDDDEAKVFAALALMSLPSFDREQPLHIVTVAAPLEEVYERNREHPGALHYLIHAYDTPVFARLGLRQARLYADIAPDSSHALHMPSHIFRHLGMWDEVAALNDRAYRVSVVWQEETGRPLAARDYHALEWLLDASIRLDRFEDAQQVIDEVDAVEAQVARRGEDPGHFAALAATMRAYYRNAAR